MGKVSKAPSFVFFTRGSSQYLSSLLSLYIGIMADRPQPHLPKWDVFELFLACKPDVSAALFEVSEGEVFIEGHIATLSLVVYQLCDSL